VIAIDATEREDVRPTFCAVGTTTLLVGSLDSVGGRRLPSARPPQSTAVPRYIR